MIRELMARHVVFLPSFAPASFPAHMEALSLNALVCASPLLDGHWYTPRIFSALSGFRSFSVYLFPD